MTPDEEADLESLPHKEFVDPDWWVEYVETGPPVVGAAVDVGEALYAPGRDQPPPMIGNGDWLLFSPGPGPPPPPMEEP